MDRRSAAAAWRAAGDRTLILFPLAGWAVLAGILCRLVWEQVTHGKPEGMQVFGAGVIAGDALFAFFSSMARNFAVKK